MSFPIPSKPPAMMGVSCLVLGVVGGSHDDMGTSIKDIKHKNYSSVPGHKTLVCLLLNLAPLLDCKL